MDVKVKARDINSKVKMADLEVNVTVRDLHAPLFERALEIPLDIHNGVANGKIKIRAYDKVTWNFPKMNGEFKCRNFDFHIWDAPDHIYNSNFDILLQENRLYFHNSTGMYGAIPMVLTGNYIFYN